MKPTHDEQRRSAALQHEAEHTRNQRSSVTFYLSILFAAAFLLLLLSFFMQQRTNQDAIDQLQQSSNSAVESLDNLIADRDKLSQENAALAEEVASLKTQKTKLENSLREAQTASDEAILQSQKADEQQKALMQLNQIRTLYNQHRRSDARALLAQWEKSAPGALENHLSEVSKSLTPEARKLYDPLEAYHSLVGWLN